MVGMLQEISKAINEDVFPRLKTRNLNVFLVGAARGSPGSLRDSVRNELLKWKYLSYMDIYYPEELFTELLGRGKDYDLLSLENLLAGSVHAVVIILESPGAIAELGAFANHKELCDRLVVVVDEKHKKAKSFIALGPLRYLEERTKSKVIYHNLRKPDLSKLDKEIRQGVKSVAEKQEIDTSIRNPIAAQHFLLGTIYVTAPVEVNVLKGLLRAAQSESAGEIETTVACALNILRRNREILLRDGKYELTDQGMRRLRRTIKLEPEGRQVEECLDELRVAVLNRVLRRKKTIAN